MKKEHCDLCGKETFMWSEYEADFEMVKEKVNIPDSDKPKNKDGTYKTKKKTVERRVNKTVQFRKQNPVTKEVQLVEQQVIKWSKPKTMMVQLHYGYTNDFVVRDFCTDCYEEKVKPTLDPFLDFLLDLDNK